MQTRSRMLGQQPQLHDEVLVDEILTRLPPAAAGRCRAVCRAWNAALTSEGFLLAHRARSAAARARRPEVLFFAPAADGTSTATLYACTLRDGEAPHDARELLTLSNLSAAAEHVVLLLSSPRPCHGLTLILDAGQLWEYYVCNLSTGEHVALPPCEQQAATIPRQSPMPARIGMGFPPWTSWSWGSTTPLEASSSGLGFDPATGEHKVVRLLKKPTGETSCEVCTPAGSGGWRWRPCAGRVPPPAASFVACLPPVFLDGSLYWLLQLDSFTGADQPIMSFSVGAEQFGWVHMPPLLARRVGNLTDLDGALCAVVDLRFDAERYALFTWSGGTSWSMRCSINLQSLPRPMSDEFVEEQVVVPLCSVGRKLLLATGCHKIFAYDPECATMEKVFSMHEFIDVPDGHRQACLLLNIGLHEESIVSVHRHDGAKRLEVKMGINTVCKRNVSDEYRDHHFSRLRDLFKELAGLCQPVPLHAKHA